MLLTFTIRMSKTLLLRSVNFLMCWLTMFRTYDFTISSVKTSRETIKQ